MIAVPSGVFNQENYNDQSNRTVNVKSEYKEDFEAALIEDKKNAEQEPGCIEIRLFTDDNNPYLIFSLESWKDHAALDYHREHPYTVKLCKLLEKYLKTDVEVYDVSEIIETDR